METLPINLRKLLGPKAPEAFFELWEHSFLIAAKYKIHENLLLEILINQTVIFSQIACKDVDWTVFKNRYEAIQRLVETYTEEFGNSTN